MILEGTFLKKDDPKIIALLQQAELLSSLALKVTLEKTEESYEKACKVNNIFFFMMTILFLFLVEKRM